MSNINKDVIIDEPSVKRLKSLGHEHLEVLGHAGRLIEKDAKFTWACVRYAGWACVKAATAAKDKVMSTSTSVKDKVKTKVNHARAKATLAQANAQIKDSEALLEELEAETHTAESMVSELQRAFSDMHRSERN